MPRATQEILFIVRAPLLPVTNGMRSTGLNLILQLQKLCKLHVLLVYSDNSTSEQGGDQETASHLKNAGIVFSTVWVPEEPLRRSLLRILAGIFAPSIFLRMVPFRDLPRALAPIKNKFCIVFGTSVAPIEHWLSRQHMKSIFFPADSIAYFQYARQVSGLLGQIKKSIKVAVALFIERSLLHSQFRKLCYVSKADRDFVFSRLGTDKCRYVPIGFNLACKRRSFAARQDKNSQRTRLIFSGVMLYEPNDEAAWYLIKKLMPLLDPKKFELWIVGLHPSEALQAAATDSIIVTGAVESIEETMQQCEIFVSPLFSGVGSKNKVLSALGCGLPVVGTPSSFSGFDSLPEGAFVAETPQQFADHIEHLRELPALELEAISIRAHENMSAHYSWKSSAEKLLAVVEEASQTENPK